MHTTFSYILMGSFLGLACVQANSPLTLCTHSYVTRLTAYILSIGSTRPTSGARILCSDNEHFCDCVDSSSLSEGSSANGVDSSYSECVVCARSEATSSEVLPYYFTSEHKNSSPTLFLELHWVGSDDPITLNAVYSVPGHHDACGGAGGRHSTRDSSGGCVHKQQYNNNTCFSKTAN